MRKILIVVGTRPNFIKITQFERVFNQYQNHFKYILVHTGQHYDYNMADVFFQQLAIKKPDYFLGAEAKTPIVQMANIMTSLEGVIDEAKPDLAIVVGDVNSTFAAAFTAHRKGVATAHLEAGLRSFDREMPEELNRILTDEICDYFFVTEESGQKHLLNEGKPSKNIFFTGNTMIDTLVAYSSRIDAHDALNKLQLLPGKYCLVTFHRPSNVDHEHDIHLVTNLLHTISAYTKVVFPVHPRTLNSLKRHALLGKLSANANIIMGEPLDYFSFQQLTKNACFVLTDSGGIQEETTYYQIPCLTLRHNTERPITITIGSNELLPFDLPLITKKISDILAGKTKSSQVPPLWDGKATERVVKSIYDILK